MEHYNVLILGAGPAGVSAGITLLRKGVDCCIVDKATFPRNKTCGGLLTSKTISCLEGLGIDLRGSDLVHTVSSVSVCTKGVGLLELDCEIPFYLVDREAFDYRLLNTYVESGGKFLPGMCVTKIAKESKTVYFSNGEQISYDYLIGADGAVGLSHKCIEGSNSTLGFGLEVDVPLSSTLINPATITLDVGYFRNGYCWCFPKGNYATIGFAFSYDSRFDYVGFFREYLRTEYGITEQVPIKGAFIPYGKGSRVIGDGSLLLVGDAAGFTDGITGEGIYYALSSGINVATAIINSLAEEGLSASVLYEDLCKPIITSVRKSWWLSSMFYRTRPISTRLIKYPKKLVLYFLKYQVSRDRYGYNVVKLFVDYLLGKQ